MSTPAVFDFERLLAPIEGENPAGRALREDFSPNSVYHKIKDARAAARAAERNQIWDEQTAQSNRSEWKQVLELAPRIIAEESKDLEISAWFCEALVREHGFAGLRDGFRLIRELAERYWDRLYPLPDEEGIEPRTAPLVGLNGEGADGVLITPIANVPLTAVTGLRALGLSDYKQAVDLNRLEDPEKRAQRISGGAVTMQMFDQAVLETPTEFYRNLWDDLGECAQEYEKLCAALEEKCGKAEGGYSLAPPSSNIRNTMQSCKELVESVSQGRLAKEPPSDAESGQGGSDAALTQAPGGKTTGRVQTRDEAFRALLQVAEFFKRTEPHSPVSYALEQAVRWGKMPLPELLMELVPEDAIRVQIFKHIGIKPPDQPA
jgi:type VI secretion system protein ImpA